MTIEIRKLRPLNGNTLVKDLAQEEKTQSGIYVPTTASEDIKTGEVLATSSYINDKGIEIAAKVKPGNKIIYRNVAGGGSSFQEDGDMYRLLVPVEILAVVE